MIPLNVEKPEVLRMRAVFQNVDQDPVLRIEGHVVGNDVLEPHHPLAFNSLKELFVLFDRPQFRVELVVVHNVVPVGAPFPGLENRRGVEAGNPEFR